MEIGATAQCFMSRLDTSHLKLEIPIGLRGTQETKLFYSINAANITPFPNAPKFHRDAVFSITDYLPQTQMPRKSCAVEEAVAVCILDPV